MTAVQTETNPTMLPADRLIVALDVENAAAARNAISELDGLVTTFKVGLQLFAAEGPRLVDEIVSSGKRVFLDLKFHDIPNTVAKAGIEAARLGVWMFNVHAAGGSEMMRVTQEQVGEFCSAADSPRPLITAVTVLTSTAADSLAETGIARDIHSHVGSLATLAAKSGLDGVVASANEVEVIRRTVEDRRFVIVTPGIRPVNATIDDQKRVMSPGAAILAGSDHLVVGRPILAAADRAAAARKILDEIGEVV
ncbi:MAG: orotidine-5'-phosphate decarboxylase [Pyrinomonadaceae bacterium]